MRHPKFAHSFEVVGELPQELAPLKKIAGNFRWTWNHETRELFRSIDKALWDGGDHNPIQFLHDLSKDRLNKLSKDLVFRTRLEHAANNLDAYLSGPCWFDAAYPGERERTLVAYFCFEFGISEGLPIYSGGLGVLAGDHLKAASDLGVPLVGVGLLYNRGYFRQRLNHDGWQQEVYPQYDFYQMPLTLMRDAADSPVRIDVEFPDRTVSCQVWKAEVGRVQLYLLDSNVLENQPSDQGITDSLYGGDEEMRIRQEMILGIGGMKALRALGLKPTVCHMNEGHAAFLSIERIRAFIEDEGCDFRTARQVVVSGSVFTTHTPVPAGFDIFFPAILERYMGKTVKAASLDFNQFLQFGRFDPENSSEPFNMAVLAMENADYVNAVAKLHAKTSKGMFSGRWASFPEGEVPIEAITNGIHTLTWVNRRMALLFDEYLGPSWREDPGASESWCAVESIPDEELWAAIENQRGDLIRFARRRIQQHMDRQGMGRGTVNSTGSILDPRVLTVGFARRFATYKRGSLMLTDRERLKRLLFHPERPVQIIVAGKSHPRDDAGKKIIQDLWHFSNQEGAMERLVFIEDYDMRVARALVQGVDVWLNNPRRPYEASGTSGMKVVPNGGLNCSILDGWWDEAYEPGVGWAIGDRTEVADQGHQDWLDSRSLYSLLENEIAPTFYHRIEGGIPRDWIRMVKMSIMSLAPKFSTHTMVKEYANRFYLPASRSYQKLAANGQERAKEAIAWRKRIRDNWSSVAILKVDDTANGSNPLGKAVKMTAKVRLGSLRAGEVKVEAVVGQVGPNRELYQTVSLPMSHSGSKDGTDEFTCELICTRPGFQGYTVRVVPYHPDVQVPSELRLVAWE